MCEASIIHLTGDGKKRIQLTFQDSAHRPELVLDIALLNHLEHLR